MNCPLESFSAVVRDFLSLPFWNVAAVLWSITITIVTVYIAVQQYIIQKNNFRLALYEKRYTFYLSVMGYIARIKETGDVSNEEMMQFLSKTKETFLFDDDIKELCGKIYDQSNKLHTVNQESKTAPDNRKPLEKQATISDWFTKQLTSAPKVFERYLRIKG
jgi:hypothetical protein